MEAAAYLSTNNRSMQVTVINSDSVPFERVLGPQVGAAIEHLFNEKGVKFQHKTHVTEFHGEDGKVNKVSIIFHKIINLFVSECLTELNNSREIITVFYN